MEVRTYDGTAEELSKFVIGVWRDAYAGKMAFPLWTPEYLSWQLDFDSPEAREHLLAAWCDGQLAGVLLGWPFRCRRGDRTDPAVLSSWLSVRPEFRGRGVVKALKVEQDARMKARGDGLIFAYRYFGSEYSLSKGPTSEQLASGQWDSRRVGFWVRIISPLRAARWYPNKFQRWLTFLGAPFTRSPRPARDRDNIRPWKPADLADAVKLLRARPQLALSIDWDEASLAKHCGPFAKCLVAEVDGVVKGLITWHVLNFVGATQEPVAIFDIIATEGLPKSTQRAILEAALYDMKQQGAVLALKLKTGDSSTWSMIRAGFIPWFSDSFETAHSVASPLPPILDRPHHVLWR
jgi:GNAT superfamily N-acetyltransferase